MCKNPLREKKQEKLKERQRESEKKRKPKMYNV
jgi:hypothetical protein